MNPVYSILDYGAETDSPRLQTSALQSAIDACASAGGGTVLVPPGVFRTGSIRLRSHVTLRLENGALLRGPDSIGDYVRYPFAWELYSHTVPLIYAVGEHDIRICGEGCIDFNGIAFADTGKLCIGEGIPEALHSDAHYEMAPRDLRPNRLVFFQACENVEIRGVTFADSPTWTLVFDRCSTLRLHDFRVKNNLRIPNNDGIHCCGCRDVLIRGCLFECGDDCIALTSISDANAVCERFLISDCIFQSRSAALRFGFEAGKVRDVHVRNCIIHESNRGIAVFAGQDGFIENISLDGLTIETRLHIGSWWGKGEPLVICSSAETSPIRNITLRNAVIRSENGIIVSCVKQSVFSVKLETIYMQLSEGNRRAWCSRKIDLAPNPPKLAPENGIPWLWLDGEPEVFCRDIMAVCRNGNSSVFHLEHEKRESEQCVLQTAQQKTL